MTNEFITPVMDGLSVLDGQPNWPVFLFYFVFVAPLLSLWLCIRAWRRMKRHEAAPLTSRIILALALLAALVSIVSVLHSLSWGFYGTAISASRFGKAPFMMLAMTISRDCNVLLIGCISVAICLLCAICLPLKISQREEAQQPPAPERP